MASLHLVKNDPNLPNFTLVDRDASTYSSGFWTVTPEVAQSLIEGKIYFHEAQREPSFFGGTILAYDPVTEGEYAGRFVFTFHSETQCKNVRAPGPWTWEKCYVP
jgi:hypothetical protein